MKIGNKKIGSGEKCFIIAEAGVNHNGDVERAFEMIDIAADARVDAIKFQTFQAEQLVSATAVKADYQTKNTGSKGSQFDMLKKLELPVEVYPELIERCEKADIIFLSTPFDKPSADLLANYGVLAYKIPSGEIINTPLLKHIALKGKPMILSTGMANLMEISQAVESIFETGNKDLVLMQCTSSYPVDPKYVNLRAMDSIFKEFKIPVGLSDHTLGTDVAMAAIAIGALIIEKHFTLDKSLPGPDHIMSLTPTELKHLVRGIRNVEAAMGTGIKEPFACEQNITQIARKSIHYSRNISVGEIADKDAFMMLRPGGGVSPAKIADFIGKTLKKDVVSGSQLHPDDF